MDNKAGNLKTTITLFCILILLCLSGCGNVGNVVDPAANPSADQGSEEAVDRSGFDWRTSEWKQTKSRGKGETLYVEQYIDHLQYDPDFAYQSRTVVGGGSYGALYCFVERIVTEEGEARYFVSRFDGDTGEVSHAELNADDLTGGESEVELCTFSMRNEEEYVFLRVAYEEGHDFGLGWHEEDDRVRALTAVHMDVEGNLVKTVDLYQGVTESGYLADRGWGQWHSLRVDRQGNYYYYSRPMEASETARKIAVLDAEGHASCVITPFPTEDQGGPEEGADEIRYLVRNPDGAPIFSMAHFGRGETKLFMYDQQKQEMKLLLSLPYGDRMDMCCCMTEDGMLYYLSEGTLYRWDLCTGGILELMNYLAEDISINVGDLSLFRNSEGKLLIRERDYYGGGEDVAIYLLNTEKPSTEGNMTVTSLTSNCAELQACAADYTKKHRQQGITVEYDAEDPEAYRDRLMAELVAGRGPEALYVSREDMETLYEKGLLEDLTDVLSQEVRDSIFPGVLECGRIDGRQVGLALDAELRTMLVNRSVWDEDSWSVEDVLSLLGREEIRSELEAVVATSVAPFGGRGIFQHLVLQNVVNSPFLDLQENTCSFDSEEFIRLLELCKQYGKVSVGSEANTLMQEGKALAYVGNFSTLNRLCDTIGSLGEDFHCVGYPTESGCGSFWSCDYFLVVRKGADCLDTVKGYGEYLYSMRRQRRQDTPLCREIYVRYIGQDKDDPGYELLNRGHGHYTALRLKPDGSSCIGDFLELAEKSGPLPRSDDAIARIVMEEAESFFAGDKDAVTVAGIIQSRVRLYLAEHS
ncbi:MAG: extracellular solute-binding protein [bacterium]|nr:extracellular solute-binding protein [bacterium]MCM1374946.1 extracellular solute-binding protein [Muribaculum sp.]